MRHHPNVDSARQRTTAHKTQSAISIARAFPSISILPPIANLLEQGAAVAIGVSGGKDSQAAAMATFEYLDRIGHSGPRLLIHADLGSVEWSASLPTCEQLSDRLGAELVVVRRCPPSTPMRQNWFN